GDGIDLCRNRPGLQEAVNPAEPPELGRDGRSFPFSSLGRVRLLGRLGGSWRWRFHGARTPVNPWYAVT
ncbi:MAG TPA: hypothetical protein P5300_11645, partial [Acidobacteriota bacterium]|nr:hypothetical protein [Acidobacteriota bacterium]